MKFDSPSGKELSFSRKLKYWAEYAGVYALVQLMKAFPANVAKKFGRLIGRVMFWGLPSRSKIAKKNLMESFPKLSEKETENIIQRCWENLGEGIADFIQMPRMSKENFNSMIQCSGLEQLQKSYQKQKGVLVITAHYGAWEIGAKFWPSTGIKTAVIARRIKNPLVNELVNRIRSIDGVKVILSRNAVRESIRWLADGNLLAILVDHRVAEGSLQIPFLNRPAWTTSLPAILALRYSVPVHPAHCWRENGKIKVHIGSAMDFTGLTANEDGIFQATVNMSRIVEDWIKERPEAWLWIHNRWKA